MTEPHPRWWTPALIALGALGLLAGLLALDASPIGVAADDAMYVMLAKALATGQGYHYLNLPGAPAATHFPPGYPALLALLWRIAPGFPDNLALFKAANAIFLGATAAGITRLARSRGVEASWALGLGAVTAISVPLLLLGAMVLSELLFIALLLPLLVALERDAARRSGEPTPLWRPFVLGVAIGLLTLVRSHAIVLVPAYAGLIAFRGRRRDAMIVLAASAIAIAPWAVWSAAHARDIPAPLRGEYGSYTGWWINGVRDMGASMIPQTLARTGGEIVAMMTSLFSPARASLVHAVALAALAIVFAFGARDARARVPVSLLFLAGYLAIVLIWPFPPSRFVWGVWPLVLLMLVLGARAAAQANWRHQPLPMIALLAAAWVAVGYGSYELRAVRGQWWSSIPRQIAPRITSAVSWTASHTVPADVVSSDDELAVYLYTGRSTVPASTFTAPQYLTPADSLTDAATGMGPILDAYAVRVVLAGRSTTYATARVLSDGPRRRLSLRQELPGAAAFTVLPR